MDENNYIDKQLSDHEARLRRLEESDVEQRLELAGISRSQAEIKLLMAEQSKDQMKQSEKQQNTLNNFTKEMFDYFKAKESQEERIKTESNKINNEMKFYNTKQFWVIASMIVGGILTYLGLK